MQFTNVPTILALLLASLSGTTNAAAISTRGNGLSFMVPPPPCLNKCITTLNTCTLCTPNNTYQACINSGCGPKDYSYASVYLSYICGDGGYVSYAFSPPKDIYVASDPRSECGKVGNGTGAGN